MYFAQKATTGSEDFAKSDFAPVALILVTPSGTHLSPIHKPAANAAITAATAISTAREAGLFERRTSGSTGSAAL